MNFSGLWKRSKSKEADEGELALLRASLKALEARQNALETDWGTVFLKMRRLYGHLTKTLALDNPPEPKSPPSKPNGEVVNLDQLTVEEILRRPEAR